VQLNSRAADLCRQFAARLKELRVRRCVESGEARQFDCGVAAEGGIGAGLWLARICTAGLADIQLASPDNSLSPHPLVTVWSDQPVAACMASQYAGWQISHEDYFAMGSGPMRAAAAREGLFERIGFQERPPVVVGTLESSALAPRGVCEMLAESCGVPTAELTLLVARTASQAGSLQVVGRSLETALHKMLELGVDPAAIVSGFGSAPLPPVAADDLVAIGRTNDAVLYGGQVTIWMRGDDADLESQSSQIPSQASPDYGQPFLEIFHRYERDFYRIDPLLFSPARVTLINLNTGHSFTAGELRPDLLRKSFSAA
jgi:methenyltetrahydromethanopterin cyclohydrolase